MSQILDTQALQLEDVTIKLKRSKLNETLFQAIRAIHIFPFRKRLLESGNESLKIRSKRLLVSAPVDIEFEIEVLESAIQIISRLVQD